MILIVKEKRLERATISPEIIDSSVPVCGFRVVEVYPCLQNSVKGSLKGS